MTAERTCWPAGRVPRSGPPSSVLPLCPADTALPCGARVDGQPRLCVLLACPHVRHRRVQCVCVTAFNPRVCSAGSFQNFSKLAPNRNIYGVPLLRPHVPMMKRGQSHPGSVPRGVPCGFKKCLNRGENI